MFAKPVNKRSRSAMADFLGTHPRYGVEYCQRVKLRELPIPPALTDAAYALLEQYEPFEEMSILFTEFQRAHPSALVSFAGRSNGYIVLYRASEPEIDRHAPTPLAAFADWELSQLRRVTRLAQDFDSLVDSCFAVFLDYAEHYEIVPETISFTRTVNILREKDHV